MSPTRWVMAVAAIGLIACAVWPLSSALTSNEALQARVVGAALTAVACAAIAVGKSGRPVVWLSLSVLSALSAVATLLAHFDASARCLADYNGRPVVIGRAYTPLGSEYLGNNPATSN